MLIKAFSLGSCGEVKKRRKKKVFSFFLVAAEIKVEKNAQVIIKTKHGTNIDSFFCSTS